MNKITVKKKTGFKNPLKSDFKIFDFRGVLFYSNELLKKKDIEFNLPCGVYYSDTDFIRLETPVKNKKIRLPKPQRNIKHDKKISIEFGNNVNKATIFHDENKILFDNSFKNKTLPEIYFCFYHEIGHKYYISEQFADLYATKKMLQKGFNKSQIGKANIMLLSSRALNRKQNVINNLLKDG